VSAAGLPSFKNPDESLAANSPIVLVDIATGERAPFFAEIDQNTVDVVKRDLIIRPLARLKPGTRYVVAIRKGVKAADGSELTSPPASRRCSKERTSRTRGSARSRSGGR